MVDAQFKRFKNILAVIVVVTTFQNAFAAKSCPVAHSSSKPVFRKASFHREANEGSVDGIVYLNPTQVPWVDSSGSAASVAVKNKTSPEPSLIFSGKFSGSRKQSSVRFHASEYLHLNEAFDTMGSIPSTNGSQRNRSPIGYSTGIRLKVAGSNPGLKVRLILTLTDRVLASTFTAPTSLTEIYIPWSQFSELKGASNGPFFALQDRFSFEFIRETQSGESQQKAPSEFEFRVDGPLVLERDVMGSREIQDFLLGVDFRVGYEFVPEGWVIPKDGSTIDENRDVLKLAIQNLHDPKNQEYAFGFAQQGDRAIEKKVNELGFGLYPVTGKVESAGFFIDTPMAYIEPHPGSKKPSPYMKTGQHTPKIPVETGAFGVEHGAPSHALQIIAMTKGMTPRQLAVFRAIYGSFFTSEVARWRAWDILFDGPGNHFPSSPLWWRDRIENLSPMPTN